MLILSSFRFSTGGVDFVSAGGVDISAGTSILCGGVIFSDSEIGVFFSDEKKLFPINRKRITIKIAQIRGMIGNLFCG